MITPSFIKTCSAVLVLHHADRHMQKL